MYEIEVPIYKSFIFPYFHYKLNASIKTYWKNLTEYKNLVSWEFVDKVRKNILYLYRAKGLVTRLN